MIVAFTGAGISAASGIPTFSENPDIRNKLSRSFATRHKDIYRAVIDKMQTVCEAAQPNDAHIALAEYNVPIITMNVDGLHQKAGSKHVLAIHGEFPNIVLYDDPAPRYADALTWIDLLHPEDYLLIVGTSYYTTISLQIKQLAVDNGIHIREINKDAEHKVREFLETVDTPPCDFETFMSRAYNF
jgi:NAD-dependent deacetylase